MIQIETCLTRAPTRLLILGLLLITACGGAATTSTTTAATTTTTTSTSTSQEPVTTTTAVEPGPADARSAIAWFVSLLNGEDITADEYAARFGDEFRSQVPFETAFQSVLEQFRPGAPYKIVETSGTGTSGEAIIEASDGTRL
ncbi:MAG: Cpe/LpqF family protein, partial [Acidimicrobiia bacterium]